MEGVCSTLVLQLAISPVTANASWCQAEVINIDRDVNQWLGFIKQNHIRVTELGENSGSESQTQAPTVSHI